ncbi:hypothetical protein EG329_002787 [Mollisiaceae sp. DMI_Dod_QoI]|nr:hypothetical protein EG329_002787 [Helotiales sp. DMI_Dod_QoI]
MDWSAPGFTPSFSEGFDMQALELSPLQADFQFATYTTEFGNANWAEFQNVMCDSTLDNTFGNPGYGNPSPALSVGSGHLSIGSGRSSNHSWSSWRGRSKIKKVFSRSSSISGRAKNAMKEGMSSWSLSGAKKHVSPSPRRTGKLTDGCDPGDPCKECTSSTKVAWQEVGCQRGALGATYKPANLCSSAELLEADSQPYLPEEEDWAAKQAEANRLWEEEMRTRCAEIGTTRLKIHQKKYSSHFSQEQLPMLFLKGPALKQQVVKAMKELAPSLEEPKRKQEVFMLLYHASLYEECLGETTSQTCNLILLSIRCLNHSLDAIRSQPSPAILHHACKPKRCGLHSIAKLQQSSSRYMDALHDVMFSKGGLSNHRYWWLAIFYSLCIQSLVRVNLIKLSGHSHQNLDRNSDARLYLHSFISLFEAASAENDPLTMEDDLSPGEMSQIILARIAVNPWHWEERGIHSSYDHLRRIFDVEQKVDRSGEENRNQNADLDSSS